MSKSINDLDQQLALEQARNYLGTVKIRVSQLTEFDSIQQPLVPRSEDVKTLEGRIWRSNLRNLKSDNHLKAVVSHTDLQRSLRAANLDESALSTWPLLEFGAGEVVCLGGRTRVRAGDSLLPRGERWWVVDLYDKSESLQDLCTKSAPNLLEI